uniref:Uncharacterized protein n=1 Tax=Pinguiococcus pyrenoidosus TaxID=172671 RepID=A0A7R9U221_9STRA
MARFHPSSVNYSLNSSERPYYAYVEKTMGSANAGMPLLRECCNLGAECVALFGTSFGPHPYLPGILLPEGLLDALDADELEVAEDPKCCRIVLKGSPRVAQAIWTLQQALDALITAEATGKRSPELKATVCQIVRDFLALEQS